MRWTRRTVPALTPSVSWSASIHDDNQLEVVFDYTGTPTAEEVPDHPDACPRFLVDVFLIAPPSIDLDAESYPRPSFFADLTQRMRLHTPRIAAYAEGRVPTLDRFLATDVDLDERRRLAPRAAQEARLFGAWINHRLKQVFQGTQLRQGIEYKRDIGETVRLVEIFKERYASRLSRSSAVVPDSVASTVAAVNDYLAAVVESALSRAALAGKPKALKALRRRHVTEDDQDHRTRLALEQATHRQGRLKKVVSEILYLEREEIHREQLYRNAVAALGAGIAATFAETARYYNTVSTEASDFALRAPIFLGIGIVAYMFKDRIKDLTKEYFGSRVKRRLADREANLAFHYVDREARPQRVVVANHREWVRYTDTRGLPDGVRYVWRKVSDARLPERTCDVLHYGKTIRLENAAARKLEFDPLAIKEVVRFDTSAFLRHLDNPLKALAVYDSEDGCVILEAPKVYHLDLLVRIACRPAHKAADTEVRVEHVRCVLDKQGIVRLDTVIPEGRYHYRQAEPA